MKVVKKKKESIAKKVENKKIKLNQEEVMGPDLQQLGFEIKKDLQNKIITLESKDNIILIKNISNPFPILKRCDLFILSSFYEALGLVLLEANTCGVACISTNVRGPRGFMEKYNGTLVENSEEGILQGMNDFVNGKIKPMNFDAEKYNQMVKEEYEKIFE